MTRSVPEPRPSFRPLYEQIKILLTQSLVAGEWKPGEAIPSEMELAQRYQVSQGTVRKAIDELASEHIVVRRQGKGTYVASHNEPAYQFRFLRVLADSGDKGYPESRLVELKRAGYTLLIVEQNAARALAIADRGYVLELGRNRFEGAGPRLLADPEVKRLYLGGAR